MMKNSSKIFWCNVIVIVLFPVVVFSQNPFVQTAADKKNILIGERVRLTIRTIFPANSPVENYTVDVPDSIQHFDIVDKGKAATILLKDNSKAIEQVITFTSFDSGIWVIPSLGIKYEKADQRHLTDFRTDSVTITVSFSPPDSTNQLRDIKPIIIVSVPNYSLYFIAGGILLLLLIAFLVLRYLKNKERNRVTMDSTGLSPYEEAMQEIIDLHRYDLQISEDVKLYHIKLCWIFKRYFGRKQNKNLRNMTTGDLLLEMTNKNFGQQNISSLATALRCGDAVKFAKYLPSGSVSEDCKSKIKETIELIEQQAFRSISRTNFKI